VEAEIFWGLRERIKTVLPIWGFQLLTKGRGCECRDFVDETMQERKGWEKAGRREPSENMG